MRPTSYKTADCQRTQRFAVLILLSLSLHTQDVVCQVKPGPKLPASSDSTAATVPPTRSKGQLSSLDYDYQDPGLPTVASGRGQTATNQGAKTTGVQRPTVAGGTDGLLTKPREDGLFYPLYGEAMAEYGEQRPPPGEGMTEVGEWPTLEGLPHGAPGMRMGGEGGEQYEWLRERVRKLRKYGLTEELETLQKEFPHVNLTFMYNSSGYGGDGYEMEEGGYFYNGTYYRRPGGEMEDGYWYNGTFYPGEIEGPEMEDGYYYNGTFYPGEMEGPEMEDGYYYNGTYYPGEAEGPELEDGYIHNGTFYPGYEQEGYEQEGYEQEGYEREEYEPEDLMWWQLHHPRWRDRLMKSKKSHLPHPQSINKNVDSNPGVLPAPPLNIPAPYQPRVHLSPPPQPRVHLPPPPQPRVQLPPPPQPRVQLPPPPQPRAQLPPPSRIRPQQPWIPTPQKLPMVQPRPPPIRNPQRGADVAHRPNISQGPARIAGERQPGSRIENTPIHAKMTGGVETTKLTSGSTGEISKSTNAGPNPNNAGLGPSSNNAGLGPNSNNAGLGPNSNNAGLGPNSGNAGQPNTGPGAGGDPMPNTGLKTPTVYQTSADVLAAYNVPDTVKLGIILACIVGVLIILAPLACLLYKYRQEKKIRKRTFLKRSEHGSVDDGIMDAMVMTELGENRGSRVQKIGRGRGRERGDRWWGEGYKYKGPESTSSSSAAKSLSRAKAELRSEVRPKTTSRSIFSRTDDDPEIAIH